MRENRLSGSEGGGTEANQFLLPLSGTTHRRAYAGRYTVLPGHTACCICLIQRLARN